MSEVDLAELAEGRVGRVLNDKWTLEGLLGVGGMAAVYSARHRNGARAAVKVLHPYLAEHANVRERFLHEGYAANRVEHPDVVKVLDDDTVEGGPDEGAAFLVMELLEGRSLEDRIQHGSPIREIELLEILLGVLGVLESAHAHGIIHRDLKPENLFLLAEKETSSPHVKVLDFGIARTIESRGMTVIGAPMGTPAFMAPEQAAGRVDEIDGRTDLYSLGATAFNVLSGALPHEGESTIDVMGKTANEQARSLRAVAPKVSEVVVRIVDKALRLERDERYPDAKAMRTDVEAALVELRSPAKKAESGELPVIRSTRDSSPPARSSGCMSTLVLLALLGVSGTVAWFVGGKKIWEQSREPTPATEPSASATAPASASVTIVTPVVVDASFVEPILTEDAATDAPAPDDASPDDASLAEDAMPTTDEDASRTAVSPPSSAKPAASHPPMTHPSAKPKPKPKPHR